MSHTVFFSWQSDTPNNIGRGFVAKALERALELLAADVTLESAVRDDLALDSDTRGVPGTPPIVDTIFHKIDKAAIFVADLTLVGKRLDEEKLTPNPNVLVEHGWALKSLTHVRTLAVMNTAYGEPNDKNLPFDLRHFSWPIRYHLPHDSSTESKRKERERLANVLKSRIGEIIESSQFKAAMLPAAPPPKPFAGQQPRGGQARFRGADDELGVVDSFAGIGGGQSVKLALGPAIWLRVMPHTEQSKKFLVADLRAAAATSRNHLLPLMGLQTASSWIHIRAQDGFGWVDSPDPSVMRSRSVAFAFVTGEVWSTNVLLYGPSPDVPNLEAPFASAFVRFADFLHTKLKIQPPLRWIAGIEQTKGKYLTLIPSRGQMYFPSRAGPCTSDDIVADGLFRIADELHLALRPFFQLIYDRCGGIQRPDHLDAALKVIAHA